MRLCTLAVLVAVLSAAILASSPPPPYTRLLFAGDVMFCREVRRQILAAHDPALPLRKLAPLMSAADITFVNLESPFSDSGPYLEHGIVFHAAPDMIDGLLLAGVTVASTANNHARDCGPHGLDFTIRWLRQHGIQPLGSGESETQAHTGAVIVRNGIRFGFLGYTFDQKNGNWRDDDPRISGADPAVLCRDVGAMRKRADVLIVSMHHGVEYQPEPSPQQIAFAHAAIDAGADVVVGHHPHVIQPREHYRGRLIVYSLGNFVFDQYQRAATQHGEMLELSYLGKQLLAERMLPVKITPTGPELE